MALKHFAVLSAVWADVPILCVYLCCPILACLSEPPSSTSADKAHVFLGVMDVLSHISMKIVFPRMSTEQSEDAIDVSVLVLALIDPFLSQSRDASVA